jgi:hypothetical protein
MNIYRRFCLLLELRFTNIYRKERCIAKNGINYMIIKNIFTFSTDCFRFCGFYDS